MEAKFDESGEQGALTISLSSAEVQEEMTKVAERLGASVSIPGFPKGKAPVDFVMNKYAVQCKAEATTALLNKHVTESLVKARKRAGIHPTLTDADRPSSGKRWVGRFDEQGNLSFTVNFEKPPVLEAIDTSDITIEVDPTMCDRWVDNQLRLFQNSVSTLKVVDRPAKSPDIVTTNVCAYGPDGQPMKGGQFDGLQVNLDGAKTPISELLAQYLSDHSAGDKFSFNQSIPLTHSDPYLRGKDVRFEAEVLFVSELVVPEMSDELVKSAGHETVQSLRDELAKEWARLFTRANRSRAALQVREQLVAKNPFTVPQKWIDEECEFVASQLNAKWSELKSDADKSAKVLEIAERTVKSDFILDCLTDRNPELLLTTDDVIKCAEEEVNLGTDGQAYLDQIKRAGQYEAFVVQSQKNKTLDWVIAQSKIVNPKDKENGEA